MMQLPGHWTMVLVLWTALGSVARRVADTVGVEAGPVAADTWAGRERRGTWPYIPGLLIPRHPFVLVEAASPIPVDVAATSQNSWWWCWLLLTSMCLECWMDLLHPPRCLFMWLGDLHEQWHNLVLCLLILGVIHQPQSVCHEVDE